MKTNGKNVLKKFETISKSFNKVQNDFLLNIVFDNKDTVFGKKHDFACIKTYEEYKNSVSISDYENYRESIKRSIDNNRENEFVRSGIYQYIETTGTSGKSKLIPQTKKGVNTYYQYLLQYEDEFCNNYFKNQIIEGKRISLLQSLDKIPVTKNGIFICSVADSFLNLIKPIWNDIYCVPKESVFSVAGIDTLYLQARFALCCNDVVSISSTYSVYLRNFLRYIEENNKLLINDIRTGTIDDSVKITKNVKNSIIKQVKPEPKIANRLEKIFLLHQNAPIVPKIWPNLKYVTGCASGNYSSIADEVIKKYLGTDIAWFRRGVCSSEAVMTVPVEMNKEESVAIADSVFYEFKDINSGEIVLAKDLVLYNDYEMIITTLSGLYRYNTKDVHTFLGYYFEAPILKFKYRSNVAVDFLSEKLTENIIIDVLNTASEELNIKLIDGALYPDYKTNTYIYMVEVENTKEIDKQQFETLLIDLLKKNNELVERYMDKGLIKPVKVFYVKKDTFNDYRKHIASKNRNISQQKMPVIIKEGEQKDFFFNRIIE